MPDPVHLVLHVLAALLLPPLLLGVIQRTKAAFAGRQGAPLLQPYRDLARLLRKGSVFSRTTTWIFRAGPVVALASTAVAVLLLPLGHHAPVLSFSGDLVLFVYLLALGRFAIALAALDTGSAFEGMGSAREVTFGALAEPALVFGLLILVKLSGSTALGGMLTGTLGQAWQVAGASLALVAISWFLVLLVENSRIPFDDPTTHLELTMVHEVMVLDHSGPAFGLVQYGAALKLFLYAALLLGVVVPASSGDPWLDWLVFLAGLFVVAILVGVVESTVARLRLTHVPKLLVAACLSSGFGVLLLQRLP